MLNLGSSWCILGSHFLIIIVVLLIIRKKRRKTGQIYANNGFVNFDFLIYYNPVKNNREDLKFLPNVYISTF